MSQTKQKVSLFLSLFFMTVGVQAAPLVMPHFDLEMSSQEYASALRLHQSQFLSLMDVDPLAVVLDTGKRNLQWLNFMNSFRDDNSKIHLTKPGDETGIPIDKAVKYSDKTVLASFAQLQKDMPTELVKILFQGADMPKDPPTDVATYIKWAHSLDRVYQMGARWILMQPYLDYLIERKALDVRGYYFLSKMTDLESQLKNWGQLPTEQKAQLQDWLLQLCHNSKGLDGTCEQELSSQAAANSLFAFYQSYVSAGKDMWDQFFAISTTRADVKWDNSSAQSTMTVPFLTPDSDKILNFLRDNIQDEWKTSSWNLQLNFQKNVDPSVITHLEFQPGVTPHVTSIAGNTIVMDQNAPIDEWDVRWTIRHEYGHTLGFLDCYLEFYDPNEKAITSYQFDLSNLMCSRQGKFQAQHFDNLKKAYSK